MIARITFNIFSTTFVLIHFFKVIILKKNSKLKYDFYYFIKKMKINILRVNKHIV